MKRPLILLFILSIILISCKSDQTSSTSAELRVRFREEPDRLHPVLSKSTSATQVETMIYLPLAEFDPYSLELTPVLLTEIPVPYEVKDGTYSGSEAINIEIKKEAEWEDGTPLTTNDVLFTLKAIFNPKIPASNFRNQLSFIKAVEVIDDQNMTIYFDADFYKAEIYLVNYLIYPQHLGDPGGLLDNTTLSELMSLDPATIDDDHYLAQHAIAFDTLDFNRLNLVGCGPYRLKYWNSGYELAIERKTSWWGEKYSASNHLKAIPDLIRFQVIPDEQSALNALKSGQIDILPEISPDNFVRLKETDSARFEFHTPAIMQYYFLVLNNNSTFFKDRNVRKAVAHLINTSELIDFVMKGMGQPLTGPFMPGGNNYDQNLVPYPPRMDLVDSLLREASWQDSNNDGIRDQMVEGKRLELIPELSITGSTLSRQISILLKDQLKKGGIGLNIEVQDFRKSMQDMRADQFDMVASVSRQSVIVRNLKPSWHSTGMQQGGGNYPNYQNPQVDSLIDQLAYTEDESERSKIHREIHRKLYNDVPVIFLLKPTERIIVSRDWKLNTSPRRPGYFVNLIEKAN